MNPAIKEPHGGSNHYLCDACWREPFDRDRRRVGVPHRPKHPIATTCCFCGKPTDNAIPYGEPMWSPRLQCKLKTRMQILEEIAALARKLDRYESREREHLRELLSMLDRMPAA